MKKELFLHKERRDIVLRLRVDGSGDVLSDRKGFVDISPQEYHAARKVARHIITRDFVAAHRGK